MQCCKETYDIPQILPQLGRARCTHLAVQVICAGSHRGRDSHAQAQILWAQHGILQPERPGRLTIHGPTNLGRLPSAWHGPLDQRVPRD